MKATDAPSYLYERLASGDMKPDEPVFILRGRDVLAPLLVYNWAMMAHVIGVPQTKVQGAHACASEMDDWPVSRVPGRPEATSHKPNLTQAELVALIAKPKSKGKKTTKDKGGESGGDADNKGASGQTQKPKGDG